MRPITYAARIVGNLLSEDKKSSHVRFHLYVGKDVGFRGHTGELCLTNEEFEDFKQRVDLEILS